LTACHVVAVSAAEYSDVRPSDWYYDDVMYLTDLGGVSGYPDGALRPNESISRAELLAMAVNTIESHAQGRDKFEQQMSALKTPDGYWAQPYIDLAKKSGALNLGNANAFGSTPSEWNVPANRAEMASLIMAVATEVGGYYSLYEISDDTANAILDYKTVSRLPERQFILEACGNGIAAGLNAIPVKDSPPLRIYYNTDTKVEYAPILYGPLERCTRAEACAMLARVIDMDRRIDNGLWNTAQREITAADFELKIVADSSNGDIYAYALLTYIGPQDSVTLYGSKPCLGFSIFDSDGKPVAGDASDEVLAPHQFVKG
jgi:hypothetical protein